MNQIFVSLDLAGRLLVLNFLMHEKMYISLYFEESASKYFMEKYPEYKTFLFGADGRAYLLGLIEEVKEEEIQIWKYVYNSGDADTVYDDSRIEKFTCPAYPNGIQMCIPISIIQNIGLCGHI